MKRPFCDVCGTEIKTSNKADPAVGCINRFILTGEAMLKNKKIAFTLDVQAEGVDDLCVECVTRAVNERLILASPAPD